MASRKLEAEILDLVADERGLPRHKVQPSSRLVEDLGMDGDDAVDFFNTIHERFGTDLAKLHANWSEHFGPEGSSCGINLVIIPVAIIGGLVAGVAQSSIVWGIALTVALLAAAWLWVMRRWEPQAPMIPVTVAEVVAAVEAGVWPSPPND